MRFIYFMAVLISIIRVDVVKYQGFVGEMISVIFVPLIISIKAPVKNDQLLVETISIKPRASVNTD